MKKKYLLGVGGHICSACLKANTTIMPVYTCPYFPLWTHKTAKQRQDNVANTTQGYTKVAERCSCFLHEVPSTKYHTIHYSHRTNYLFPIQLSGSWLADVGFWVSQGTKEASSSAVSKQESASNPRKMQFKTLVLYSVISSDGLCFQNGFISSCQSLFNLWIHPRVPS